MALLFPENCNFLIRNMYDYMIYIILLCIKYQFLKLQIITLFFIYILHI